MVSRAGLDTFLKDPDFTLAEKLEVVDGVRSAERANRILLVVAYIGWILIVLAFAAVIGLALRHTDGAARAVLCVIAIGGSFIAAMGVANWYGGWQFPRWRSLR